ncbi:MAG: radical SAM protein [Nitrososphaerota archaeon]
MSYRFFGTIYMYLDVLLIHPPAVPKILGRPYFPGPVSQVSIHTTSQYIQVSQGILSIADFLDRNGFKVLIDNVGERIAFNPYFDVRRHIKQNPANVYAIELHWYNHIPGAVEMAKICKEEYPNSLVVLGGLTATIFYREILEELRFVDAVIRGEAEKAFLDFLKSYENKNRITPTPNIAFRDGDRIVEAPMIKQSNSLDEFSFSRIDLLEPKMSIFTPGTTPHYSFSFCRGCIFNCVTCGGAAYTYRKYFNMPRLFFMSPEKVVEELRLFVEKGVRNIGLLQDIRMAGRKYWEKLFSLLRKEDLDFDRLTMDLFTPANEEYIRAIASTGKIVTLNISPESGSEKVRSVHGRNYTNKALIEMIKKCHENRIPVTVFFMIGLAEESYETINETWALIDKLAQLDAEALSRGIFKDIEQHVPVAGPIIGHMILLDPGSLAYDKPGKYGYRVLFKGFRNYLEALLMPHWSQRINYETKYLSRNLIIELIYESIKQIINVRARYRLFSPQEIFTQLLELNVDKILSVEIEKISALKNEFEKWDRLTTLKYVIDISTSQSNPVNDPYGYYNLILHTLQETEKHFHEHHYKYYSSY